MSATTKQNPRLLKEHKPRPMTQKRIDKLRAAYPPENWPAVEFALETGLRAIEQFSLTADDVDLLAGLLYVPGDQQNGGRVVPLSKRAKEIAEDAMAARPDGRYLFGAPNHPNRQSASLVDTVTLWTASETWAKSTRAHWEDLRATYARRLEEQGTPPHVIQGLLGEVPRG